MTDNKKKKIILVNVSIENKPFLNDPEGETILNDLILKENYSDIISVRSAKSFLMKILSKNEADAISKVKKKPCTKQKGCGNKEREQLSYGHKRERKYEKSNIR